MPKRSLSAYNIFFQKQRLRIFEESSLSGERIGFQKLGKTIGERWRNLRSKERREYERIAEKDIARYRKEMDAYEEARRKRISSYSTISPTNTNSAAETHLVDADADARRSPLAKSVLEGGNVSPRGVEECPIAIVTPRHGQHTNNHHPSAGHQQQHWGSNGLYQQSRSGSFCAPSPDHPPRHFVNWQNATPCSPHRRSFAPPPPPPHPSVAIGSQASIPDGTEVFFPDETGRERKYRVHYNCCRMTREQANEYIERMAQQGYTPKQHMCEVSAVSSI